MSKHMHHNGFEAKICVMDRLRYGPCWRNKKAEVGQSKVYIKQRFLMVNLADRRKVKFCNTSNGTEISLQIFNSKKSQSSKINELTYRDITI
ncbi:hypothetical protein [Bacillus mojavensis]|uniref:hypothetical protein n=1 Tax=Bacillus mojavensis TaxID=72360 RepID=UPI00145551DC|nr:hypothetical protein [Bacillus mojavensis]